MARIAFRPTGPAVRPGFPISGIRAAVPAAVRFLGDSFAAERSRWALWIPVLMGAGIALYFSLNLEPARWVGGAGILLSLLAAAGAWRRQALSIAAYAVFFLSLGFGVAQLRTALVAAPVLHKKIGPVVLEGRVARIEVLTKGRRLWLDSLSINRLDRDRTPARIRIRYFGKSGDLRPGDRVRLRAVLLPPPGPAMPGAFDFARRAYFQRLGGVGYAVGPPAVVGEAPGGGFSVWIAGVRHRITRTIYEKSPGPAGAIAAALMTGERGAIPEDILDAMRESGLAHLLAISGLHIGLVGGLLFFSVRLGLACWERVALRCPIKKWAAVAAFVGSLAYLLISGATLPTQRAFLMLSLVLLAVLIDRAAISMNMVAWAAGVILLIAPESLMSVSFQMSFAAVTALVATYEFGRVGRLNHAGGGPAWRRAVYYLAAVLLTTLVAGAATAPYALYHFNQVALYGMAANLLAVPLTALWVMPWAILAFLLMPFGLEGIPLAPMGWGIDGVIHIAQAVRSVPGAVATLPAMPGWGFALVCLGGLWLCLWRLPWRLIGIAPAVIGIAAIALVRTPDILVSDTGALAAVKGDDGMLSFMVPARGFVAETWLRRAGQGLTDAGAANDPATAGTPVRCDGLGCIIRARGQIVAYVKEIAALPEDCGIATILISRVPVRRWRCTGPALVIDRFDVWRAGAHAVWLGPDGIRVRTVAGTSSRRPWSRYPRKRRR